MPEARTTSRRAEALRSSLFATLARRLSGYSGPRFPLHIGDNQLPPPPEARWPRVPFDRFGDPYAYGHPAGEGALREALALKVQVANGMSWADASWVQVAVGATHALTCAVQALVDPGDEVLLLTPHWPLIRGIVVCAGAVPVEVPFYQALLEHADLDVEGLLDEYLGERVRALYLITPNNPNGAVLERTHLEAIARFAQRHDLWVISDEAYESYVYGGEHVSIATLDGMAQRTVSAFTFSKTYAMAGTRMGYAVGPPEVASAMAKVATHTVYNPAQASQAAALMALEHGGPAVASARATYAAAAARVAERLDARFFPAQGGSFVFVDLREHGPDAMPILEAAADVGVTLAPGAIFGGGFEGFARLCYTAVPADVLDEGLDRLSAVLARARSVGLPSA